MQDLPSTVLAEVVRAERAALVRAARREGLDPEDAVECVQDALCTFLGLARRGELDAAPEAWGRLLTGIVKNAARNRRRRRANERGAGVTSSAELEARTDTAEESLARAEVHVRLRLCVAELCEVQRAVVLLRLLEERPGEDVAATLGITRGYVDVLAHRARAALRTCLTQNPLPESP